MIRFNIKDRDIHLKSQNSGVLVRGDENAGNLDYFGVLIDIIELSYLGKDNVILFKCDWWDVCFKKGYKEDKYGFILINSNRKLRTNEPYVLASQVQQVYYVKDTKDPNWLVVVKTKPRDLYDMPMEATNEVCQENEDIGSISYASKTSYHEQEFSLDRNDLARFIANGKPVMPMEVVDSKEESESSDYKFDSTEDEDNKNMPQDDIDVGF
ncbi:hypothetical protein VNO78_23311 [Psophocarpus tetragonolobus]|uniref:DUF4216 domain-containing protein n=1 Tax=Psophocarpus tetragonolobus TaxID=3891 RepID=A0AAN9S330_PSOTE